MGLNKIQVIGNLGKEPESRVVGQSTVLSFSVGMTEKFKGQDGSQQERTEWFNCEWWNPNGGSQYLHKGTQVYIEGSQKTESWQDQQGQNHSIVKLRVFACQLLGSPQNPQQNPQGYAQPAPQYQQPAPPQYQQPQQYPPQYQQPQGGYNPQTPLP